VDNAEDYTDFLEKEGYLVHYSAVKDKTLKQTPWGVMVAVRAKDFRVIDYDQRGYSNSTAHQFWVLRL